MIDAHAGPEVQACGVPAGTRLDPRLLNAADYVDAYGAGLQAPGREVVELFFAVFGHRPWWMKAALATRNRVARWCGLEAPSARELFSHERRRHYAVGDHIGVWPIFTLADDELIVGRDNRHMDFRLSVFRQAARDGPERVVVTTACRVRNRFGRVYLAAIIPFHRWGLRLLIARAVRSGRL